MGCGFPLARGEKHLEEGLFPFSRQLGQYSHKDSLSQTASKLASREGTTEETKVPRLLVGLWHPALVINGMGGKRAGQ